MSTSRLYKSMKNMLSGAISQVLAIFLSFVSRTIFLRYLSTEYLGINGLFSNILTILSFAELGIGNAMIFSMYKPLKDNDIQKLKKLMHFYKKSYRYIALVVAGLGLILVPFLKFFINSPPNIKESLTIIYLLYLFNSVSTYLVSYKKSIIIADQNSYIVIISQNIFNIIQLIAQSIILIITQNFILYLCLQIISNLLNNIIISYVAEKMYPYLNEPVNAKLSKEESKLIFTDIKALTISKLAGVVANGTDNIIVSRMLGLTSVGLVSNYSMIINAINGICWSFFSGVTASIGNLNTEKNINHRIEIFNQLFLSAYWMYSFICVSLLVLLNPFISLWIGTDFLVDNFTVFSLVLIIYVSGVNYPCFVFRTTLGFFDQVKYAYVFSAILNLILSIILGKTIGLAGVFLATSLSRLVTSEVADGFYVYEHGLELSSKKYFSKYYIYFMFFLGNYLLTANVVKIINYAGIGGFIVKVLVCIITSNLINLALFFRSDTFKGLKLRLTVFTSGKF